MINVLAEAATVEGTGDKPGYLPGYGALPAAMVTELAKHAMLRPVTVAKVAIDRTTCSRPFAPGPRLDLARRRPPHYQPLGALFFAQLAMPAEASERPPATHWTGPRIRTTPRRRVQWERALNRARYEPIHRL